MLRGSALDGLAAIRYQRDDIYIRPILDCPRELIEAYCAIHELEPVIDHTNLETDYLRNKIRLMLIPELVQQYNPNLMETIARNVALIQQDADFMDVHAHQVYDMMDAEQWSIVKFAKQPQAMRLRVLRLFVEVHAGSIKDVGSEQIRQLDALVEKGITGKRMIIKGSTFTISNGRLIHEKKMDHVMMDFEKELHLGKNILSFEGRTVSIYVRKISKEDAKQSSTHCVQLDVKKLPQKLYVRNRRSGDRFKPMGMQGKSKKIKDILIDQKIPRHERDYVLIFTHKEDIVWIDGYRINHDFKIDSATSEIIEIEVENIVSQHHV
jgi:tRNA(Ile)-lysidine synthase